MSEDDRYRRRGGQARRYPTDQEVKLHYERSLERTLVPKNALEIGYESGGARTGYYLPQELNTHLHIVGFSGRGKTNVLQVLGAQLLQNHERTGEGMAVIDPHGGLAEYLLDLCVLKGEEFAEKVVHFDMKERGSVPLFNPLRSEFGIPTVAKGFVEAMTKLEGKTSTLQSPLISEVLNKTVRSLLYNNLTIAEASFFTRHTDENEAVRRHLLETVSDRELRGYWEELSRLPMHQKREQTAHAARRFDYLVEVPTVKRIMGHADYGIDLLDIMERGQIAIFDLSREDTEVTQQAQMLIATLLVQEFRTVMERRKRDLSLPFYLVIDEFGEFVTPEIMAVITGARKRGLRCIFAHQDLAQLIPKDGDAGLYNKAMGIEQKIIFGGGMFEEQLALARQVYAEHIDQSKKKSEIWQTKHAPALRKIILESGATASSEAARGGTSAGISYDEWGNPIGHSEQRAESSSATRSESSGWSEAVINDPEEFKELSSVQFWSFDEQLTGKAQELRGQPIGVCTISRIGQEPLRCQVPLADDLGVSADQRKAFLERVHEKPCYLSVEEADRRIETRTRRLLQSGGVLKSLPAPSAEFDPDDVWEED